MTLFHCLPSLPLSLTQLARPRVSFRRPEHEKTTLEEMPEVKSTFLQLPFRYGPGLTARARSKLSRAEQIIDDPNAEPTERDKVSFHKGLKQLGEALRTFFETQPADAPFVNSFIAAEVLAHIRYVPDLTPMARTTLTRLVNEMGAAMSVAPSFPEKIRLWDCLLDYTDRALDKLLGRAGGRPLAAAAAAGEGDDESSRG